MAFASHGRQAILPPTFGFVTCARTASPCFTRPRFELGPSSRAPQVSAQRFRLSCSIKSRVFSFMRDHVLNVGRPRHTCPSSPIDPVVITLGVFDDPVMDSSRVVLWLHPRSVGQSLLELFGHPLPWHSMATSSITNSLVQNLRPSFHSQAPGTSPVHQLGCELLSLCSSTQDHFSRNSHKPMPTTTENDRHCESQRQGDNKHRTDRCGSCFKSDIDVSLP